MKAIILQESGGVDKLVHTEIPKPEIASNEVLVKVKSVSINPIDVNIRVNEDFLNQFYGLGVRPIILGWDISGEIIEKGSEVRDFELGDEVFGMVNFPGNGKAYAKYVAVPTSQLALKPSNISYEEAAAATLAALTAWQALVVHAKIKAGDRVLIHAASGGVGHFAVQIAKNFGAYVIGTASDTNRDYLLSLGIDEHIDYKKVSFAEILSNIDVVLDSQNGQVLTDSIGVTKEGGCIVSILPNISDEQHALAKNNNISLSFMMVHSSGENMKSIAELLESGKLKARVFETFAFKEMDKAHLQVETGHTSGKVIVNL